MKNLKSANEIKYRHKKSQAMWIEYMYAYIFKFIISTEKCATQIFIRDEDFAINAAVILFTAICVYSNTHKYLSIYVHVFLDDIKISPTRKKKQHWFWWWQCIKVFWQFSPPKKPWNLFSLWVNLYGILTVLCFLFFTEETLRSKGQIDWIEVLWEK